jgi:hypothetical protein
MPWAAIVAAERRALDVRILAVGAAVTASMVFVVYWGEPYAIRELLVLSAVRAVCIAGLASVGFSHREVDAVIERNVGSPEVQPVISAADG